MKKRFLLFWILAACMLVSMIDAGTAVNDELLKISKEYRTTCSLYNSKDYWTLALCEPYYGPGVQDDTLHYCNVEEKHSPHGDKLYKLYVKDKDAYHKKLDDQPVGQVVIKEVWNVRAVDYYSDSVQHYELPVKRSAADAKYYTPTSRKQLFIMYKAKPSKENDEGWWYGIVDIEKGVDNMKVIESMKINRCMKCHEQSKHDRMIGVDN